MTWPHTRDARGHQQERREGPPTARRSTALHAVTAVLGLRTGRGQTSGAPAAQLWSPLPEPGHCVGGGIEHKAGRSLLHNLRLQRQFKNTYEINCPCLGWPHVSEADRERCGSLQVTERHHGRAAGLPATGEWCQDGTRHAGHALPPGGQSATLRNSRISLRKKQELWRLRSL